MMIKKSYLFLLCCILSVSALAQRPFTNCSAAFLNSKLVVDEYTDEGKCVLDSTATGILTVCTAELWPEKDKSKPVDKLKFMIAIRDRGTHTLMMFSENLYTQIDIQKVLRRCRKGDSIVLLTMKDEYALPHNEILVR